MESMTRSSDTNSPRAEGDLTCLAVAVGGPSSPSQPTLALDRTLRAPPAVRNFAVGGFFFHLSPWLLLLPRATEAPMIDRANETSSQAAEASADTTTEANVFNFHFGPSPAIPLKRTSRLRLRIFPTGPLPPQGPT